MAMNYGVAGMTFFGNALALRKCRGRDDVLNYAGAGMISGTFLTLPLCGPARSLMGGGVVAAVGTLGYFASLRLQGHLDELAAERRRELYGAAAAATTTVADASPGSGRTLPASGDRRTVLK
ncbi:unnamed protein product [Phaeothamnion confervicola]